MLKYNKFIPQFFKKFFMKKYTPEFSSTETTDSLKDWVSPSTIKGKLVISFILLILATGICNTIALFSISRLQNNINILKDLYKAQLLILQLNYKYPYLQDEQEKLNKLTKYLVDLDKSNEINQDIKKQLSFFIIKIRNNNLDSKDLKQLSLILKNLSLQTENAATFSKRLTIWFIIYLPPVYIFASALLAIWVISPLERIRKSVSSIMEGENTTLPIESAANCKECAELVYAINKMLNALECKHHQLIQSEKMAALGRVTASIAHEINNPLNNILLSADLLLEEQDITEETEEVLKDIVTQTVRARKIVRHLLEFSRAGKPSAKAQIDLIALINETLNMLRQQLKMGKIKVFKELPSGFVCIEGNPTQLQQVLVNIILNSIEAMDAGGQLIIRLEKTSCEAIIKIADTGPGIPPEVADHIFDPFYTTKTKGTGLGLSVSYGIVKEHEGEIRLESEPGKGAVFYIHLPLAPKYQC